VSSSEAAIVGKIPCGMIKGFADIKYTVTKTLLHLIRQWHSLYNELVNIWRGTWVWRHHDDV